MSRTAVIRATARSDEATAEAMLTVFLADIFGIHPENLHINHDQYSLNSLNGFFDADGAGYFFKFHQEEGEAEMRGEYYRAEILSRAGLPVDMPVLCSRQPGEQILVYRRRSDPRFSDVLRALDLVPDAATEARAIAAEAGLNEVLLQVAQQSLSPITASDSTAEPIHRLFHARLIDPATGRWPGGRYASFYHGQPFVLPGCTLAWDEIAGARIILNGLEYRQTLGELFRRAHERLAPERLADAGGIVAHGDAHNANVWYERGVAADRLVLFDPAFAGEHVPSLLAEIKSTFHNTLAHPFWLYDSQMVAGRYHITARHADGRLHLDTDWSPGPLREGLLAAKADRYWRPWLATLAARGLLPGGWEEVMRLALFLCPTLVMNLRAGADRHTPQSSALGLFVAIMAATRPIAGADRMTAFFERIRP